jgi:hypothetical protein
MPDLFNQLEVLQAKIDTLRPGRSQEELQAVISLIVRLLDELPHRIAVVAEWDATYAEGRRNAEVKFRRMMCEARRVLRPPED